MTRRQDLEAHRRSLGEIREILNSMKTLAYLETRKLSRFADAQEAVVEGIEAVASDFVAFHPETLPRPGAATDVCLVIGSERGFCRDFNPRLLEHLESGLGARPAGGVSLIAVGQKLSVLLGDDPRVEARLDGPSVAEEVFAVIQEIVRALTRLQEVHGLLAVRAVYHGVDGELRARPLLPPYWQDRDRAPRHRHPPALNLAPEEFLVGLTEHYLFAVLHAMLYASLFAENQGRVSHLEGAVRYLDDESERIAHRCRTLRQEEIIEEIEVILLSAGSIEERSPGA